MDRELSRAGEKKVRPRLTPSQDLGRRVALPALLPRMRDVDLEEEVNRRVFTFQALPRQLRGILRNAMRVALEAVRDAEGAGEMDGWKLFPPRTSDAAVPQTGLYPRAGGGATASGTIVLRRRMGAAAPRGCRVGVGHTTAVGRNQPRVRPH